MYICVGSMAKMTFQIITFLELFLMATSFIDVYLDTSSPPKPNHLIAILQSTKTATVTTTTTFAPPTSTDQGPALQRNPAAHLTYVYDYPANDERKCRMESDIVDRLCDDRKFLVFLVYNYLHGNCNNKGYNKFLHVFAAKPLAIKMCKKKNILENWVLQLYDTNRNDILDPEEDQAIEKDYRTYLASRTSRRKRRHHRKSRHRKSRRNHNIKRSDDR